MSGISPSAQSQICTLTKPHEAIKAPVMANAANCENVNRLISNEINISPQQSSASA